MADKTGVGYYIRLIKKIHCDGEGGKSLNAGVREKRVRQMRASRWNDFAISIGKSSALYYILSTIYGHIYCSDPL